MLKGVDPLLGPELLERQDAQHRLHHPRGAGSLGADEAPCVGGRREVGVDDGDLVGMAHGAQRRKQFGPEQRIDAFQHAATASVLGVGASRSIRFRAHLDIPGGSFVDGCP